MKSITLDDITGTVLTEAEIKAALAAPGNFFYLGDRRDEMFVTWSLGPVICHRDSPLLDQSNADILRRRLAEAEKAELIEAESWEAEEANHWAVGWVTHLSFRVLDEHGQPTRVARFLKWWFSYLKEIYPVADDDHFSKLEHDALIKAVYYSGKRLADELDITLPEDWTGPVVSWLYDNDQAAVENHDGRGASPDRMAVLKAFAALGYVPPSDPNEDAC